MEYEEDDGAEGDAVQLQEQIMHVPNLPLPKPSDGNVCSMAYCLNISNKSTALDRSNAQLYQGGATPL